MFNLEISTVDINVTRDIKICSMNTIKFNYIIILYIFCKYVFSELKHILQIFYSWIILPVKDAHSISFHYILHYLTFLSSVYYTFIWQTWYHPNRKMWSKIKFYHQDMKDEKKIAEKFKTLLYFVYFSDYSEYIFW